MILGAFWHIDVQVNSLRGKPIADARGQARLRQHSAASLPSISMHVRFNKCCPFI